MTQSVVLLVVAVLGVVAGWAITVPVHRYKEQRPLTPRDIAAEVGTVDSPPPLIRASYREARCGTCHRVCSWRDVTPVVSWFRGCAGCGTRFPLTVPLVQVAVPVAMVVTVSILVGSWIVLPYLFLIVVLSAIAVIDLRIWLIPSWMPWAGAAVGLGLIAVVSTALGEPALVVRALLGAVVTFAFFFVLFVVAPGKLGFGDVRLAFLLGMFLAWLHPILPVYGLLFGAVIALGMGAVALVSRQDSRFPFGPALALGTLAAIWFHEPILRGLG